jgi:hypothetical protein
MSAPVEKIEYTKEELVEVERFRLFLNVTGILARTTNQAYPPDPPLLELLRAADPDTNWPRWLGITFHKPRVEDDHPHP